MLTFYQHMKKSNSSLILICLPDVIGTVDLIRRCANVVGWSELKRSERRCARLARPDGMYRPPGISSAICRGGREVVGSRLECESAPKWNPS